MKNRWLDRGVVFGVQLTLCTTEKMFNREYKRMTKRAANKSELPEWCRPNTACVHTLASRKANLPAMIVCIDAKSFIASPLTACSMLAHEAVHIKQELMACIGEETPSDEFEAYVVQNTLRTLLEEYQRQIQGMTPGTDEE